MQAEFLLTAVSEFDRMMDTQHVQYTRVNSSRPLPATKQNSAHHASIGKPVGISFSSHVCIALHELQPTSCWTSPVPPVPTSPIHVHDSIPQSPPSDTIHGRQHTSPPSESAPSASRNNFSSTRRHHLAPCTNT